MKQSFQRITLFSYSDFYLFSFNSNDIQTPDDGFAWFAVFLEHGEHGHRKLAKLADSQPFTGWQTQTWHSVVALNDLAGCCPAVSSALLISGRMISVLSVVLLIHVFSIVYTM